MPSASTQYRQRSSCHRSPSCQQRPQPHFHLPLAYCLSCLSFHLEGKRPCSVCRGRHTHWRSTERRAPRVAGQVLGPLGRGAEV
jgi:hypothetical protein